MKMARRMPKAVSRSTRAGVRHWTVEDALDTIRCAGVRRSARDTSINRGSMPRTAVRLRISIGQTLAKATITISIQ